MTENKEDIQAQIDQLDSDWERDCEPFMVQGHERNPKRAPEAITVEIVFLFRLVCCAAVLWFGYHLYEYWTYTSPEWIEGDVPYDGWGALSASFLYVLFFLFVWKVVSQKNARYDGYIGLKQSYESKRAELQAKLDAFREVEGS